MFCDFAPDIDCFANRLDTQLSDYVSFKPDPFAKFIDAFTLNWNWFKPYLFPPFSILGQMLRKIRDDKAEVLLIAPVWPTKSWYNTFLDLLVGKAMIIPPHQSNLVLPTKPGEVHPLHNLTFMAGKLSAKSEYYENKTVEILLQSWERGQKRVINLSVNGSCIVTS